MQDDLTIPRFLRPTGPTRKHRPRRWTKLVLQKPEAQTWAKAEVWTLSLGHTMCELISQLPAGQRRVWAVTGGHKWVHVYDRGDIAHIRVSLWAEMVRTGAAKKV